jgi:23S rRNA pseudouridine1911/1915/1917 synthase
MSRAHYIGPRDVDPEVDLKVRSEARGEELADDDSAPQDAVAAEPAYFTVGPEHDGWRLDRALAAVVPSVSRGRIQGWIEQDGARINARTARARDRVHAGDRIDLDMQQPVEALAFEPEPMALQIVYEDELLIVIDKPAGLVVHPGAGNWSGTLLNGLLAHRTSLSTVPRAGIVHRLDAGTSGLMVVAKSVSAQVDLVRQLQQRQVVREYWAVATGIAPSAGTIDAALSRDPRNRLRFSVSASANARNARTHFRRIAVFEPTGGQAGVALSWLACRLETGRTHQIRVHLESIGHPLLGDPLYSRRRPASAAAAHRLNRQALHACRLSLWHPGRAITMTWFRPPPEDLQALMRAVGFAPDRPIDVFEAGPAQ